MTRASSLQWRLCLGLTLGISLLWLVATLAASLVVQHALNKAFDSALEETAQRLLPLAVVDIINRETPGIAQQIAPLQAHDEYLTYLVRDSHGAILLRSHDADPAVFNARPLVGFSSTPSHRIYAVSALRETLFIEVAAPLAERHAAALEAALAILLPLLLLIPLSVLGTWLLVRRSLRHVLAYGRAIEARGVGDLSPIGAAQLPAEIAPLAEAVNQLMARLRRALDAERSFTANSAHELRTPMATALAQVQRLHREAPEGPLQTRAAQIEESLHALVRLSEKLMQLAKAEGGGLLAHTPQDLRPLLEHVVADLRRSVGERLRLTLPESAVLSSIDVDALAILLRNLIENACKHGDAQQPVTVSLSAEGLLRVVNAGPPVPAPVLAQLTERFVRGNSAAHGSGLGLAIAQAITQGVGASLTLTSPAPGKADGFEASVQFA